MYKSRYDCVGECGVTVSVSESARVLLALNFHSVIFSFSWERRERGKSENSSLFLSNPLSLFVSHVWRCHQNSQTRVVCTMMGMDVLSEYKTKNCEGRKKVFWTFQFWRNDNSRTLFTLEFYTHIPACHEYHRIAFQLLTLSFSRPPS